MIICTSKPSFYFFTNSVNKILEKNILKFTGINIICKDLKEELKFSNLLKIKSFCKRNNLKFYIADNFKLAIKLNADGIYISSWNKIIYPLYKSKFEFIGAVHHQKDFYYKLKQRCTKITLSPLFLNSKYSVNKILGTIKFNLLSKYFGKCEIIALGGINSKNLRKVYLTKSAGVGFASWINKDELKKPVYFKNIRA